MVDESLHETSISLEKLRRICRVIRVILQVLFILFCAAWIVAAVFLAQSLTGGSASVSALGTVLYLVNGALIAVVFVLLIGVFSDAAKGKTPFSLTQVKRLRLISAVLVAYAILDMFNTSNMAILQFNNGIDSGYITTNGNTIVAFNMSPLIAAAVVFAFSFVFKYGVLLQELSDETL